MDGFLLSLYAAAGGFTTSNRLSPGRRSQDFDPCSLCGERRTRGGKGIIKDTFQFTLSLRRATVRGTTYSGNTVFQSTLSLRRATLVAEYLFYSDYISIHALLAESDSLVLDTILTGLDFNPRSPCGERPAPSLGPLQRLLISIHALLAESDRCRSERMPLRSDFNPRSPCGERRGSL